MYVELVGGGSVLADELVLAMPLNDHGRAVVAQFNPLLHALCMLADTGGSVGHLTLLTSRFIRLMEQYSVTIPAGYRLANLDYEYDVPKKYVFVRDEDGEQVHVRPDIDTKVFDGTVASRPPRATGKSVRRSNTKGKAKAAEKCDSEFPNRKESYRKAKASRRVGKRGAKTPTNKRG